MSGLDFSDEAELAKLRQLYETLQTRILDMLDALQTDPERRLMQGNRQSRDFGSREK